MKAQELYHWLGSEARAVADWWASQEQLVRELPALDGTEEDG
jgi:hypothetical protein